MVNKLTELNTDYKNLCIIQKSRLDAQSFLCFQIKLTLKMFN
jgi:hypothetical protein